MCSSDLAETEMLDEFKLQALSFLQFQPVDDWDWLALAQHYGMATRLLDWTANPIAAFWFAVERPAVDDGPGVVWVFDTKKTDYVSRDAKSTPFSGVRTAVFRPRHITRRIVAQSGWFTVHKYLEDQKRFIALEKNTLYSKRMKKVTIPAASFADIRRELDRCGFNDATLYADLDGLCRDLNRRNPRLEDEEDEADA